MNVDPCARTIARYASWLPRLSDRDRDHARTRAAEIVEKRIAEPERPEWGELYFTATAAAIDADDPVGALHGVLADGDPAEVCRALAAFDRTSNEWAQWWPAWHPCSN